MAASATLALKAGVWFRRGLLLIVSPVRGHHRRSQAETPLIDLFKFASPALLAQGRSKRMVKSSKSRGLLATYTVSTGRLSGREIKAMKRLQNLATKYE